MTWSASEGTDRVDLRLVPAALTSWAVTAAGIVWPVGRGLAIGCLVVAAASAWARWRAPPEATMARAVSTALLAGGMLAFALSFDEVIVTTFTAGNQSTLPIWMLEELIRPRQRPVTNVVAMAVVLVTVFPILAAYWLTREGQHTDGAEK